MLDTIGRRLPALALLLLIAGSSTAAGREEACSLWVSKAVAALETEIGSKTLIHYRAEYVTAFTSLAPSKTSWSEVGKSLKTSRRVLLGDQHDRAEFQELAIDVMELMDAGDEKPTLVIEFIQQRFQGVLDRWMAGEISDAALKKEAYDPSEWGFSWRSYRAVLGKARELGWRVQAVELPGRQTLPKRDERIAAAISKIEGRVLVFYGAYHLLGKKHLADRVDPDLVITPVAEDRYWTLLRSVGGNPRAIRLGDEVVFVNLASSLELNMPYLETLMGSLEIGSLEDLAVDYPDVGDCPCEEKQ